MRSIFSSSIRCCQVLDCDGSGDLSSEEFQAAIKKLVRLDDRLMHIALKLVTIRQPRIAAIPKFALPAQLMHDCAGYDSAYLRLRFGLHRNH